jgi:hypothetical protein
MESYISLDGQHPQCINSSPNSSSSHTLTGTPNRQAAPERSQSAPEPDPAISDEHAGQENAFILDDDMRPFSIPELFEYHEEDLDFEYPLVGMTEQEILLEDPRLDFENASYLTNPYAGAFGLAQETTGSIYGNANLMAEEELWRGLAVEEDGTISEAFK